MADKYCIMIDTETLSTKSNAAILSVAAVKFLPDVVQTDAELRSIDNWMYFNIDIYDSIRMNRDVNMETVLWWSTQKPAAWDALQADRQKFFSAMIMTSSFLQVVSEEMPFIYCNPASFDFPILKSAFEQFNIKTWEHYQERCYRTYINEISKLVGIRYKDITSVKEFMRSYKGDAHNAMDDCIKQIGIMQRVRKYVHDSFISNPEIGK